MVSLKNLSPPFHSDTILENPKFLHAWVNYQQPFLGLVDSMPAALKERIAVLKLARPRETNVNFKKTSIADTCGVVFQACRSMKGVPTHDMCPV